MITAAIFCLVTVSAGFSAPATNGVLIGMWICPTPDVTMEIRPSGAVVLTDSGTEDKGDWHYRANLAAVPATLDLVKGSTTIRTIINLVDTNTLWMMPPGETVRPKEFTREKIVFVRNGPRAAPKQPTREMIEEAQINSNRAVYEVWISNACPYLAKLPTDLILIQDFTRYRDLHKSFPMIEYSIRGNRKDALFSIFYTIETDAHYAPIALKSAGCNFVLLSSRTITPGQTPGLGWDSYLGVDVPSGELPGIVARIIKGDDFSDLAAQTLKEKRTIRSSVRDTDRWRKL